MLCDVIVACKTLTTNKGISIVITNKGVSIIIQSKLFSKHG